jgi:hypothetical protein
MQNGDEGNRVRAARLRWSANARTIAKEWWGPAALAAYALSPLSGTALQGNETFVWAGWTAVAAVVALIVSRRLSSTQLMALEVLVASLISDNKLWSGGLRDLHLYLRAGGQFIAGTGAYTVDAITKYPSREDNLPFLYAPPTLPFFGLLSTMPVGLVEGLWVCGSVAAVVASLRAFGLSWRWSVLALAWTPIEQGIFVGNVVIPSLLLLAFAPRLKSMTALGPIFKPQNTAITLWLVRERSWRELVVAVGAVAALVAVTLPLTGLGAWRDWISGLAAYQQSQQFLPGLFGIGLGRFMPAWLFAVLAIGVILGALRAGGREGLARLGLASVVASPSLWSHGFVFAIPAFLRLRADWFWLVAGLMCLGKWPGPQAVLAIAVASWFVPALNRTTPIEDAPEPPRSGVLHPLGAVVEPWPGCPD